MKVRTSSSRGLVVGRRDQESRRESRALREGRLGARAQSRERLEKTIDSRLVSGAERAKEERELTTLTGFADCSSDGNPDADDLVTCEVDESVEEVQFETVSRQASPNARDDSRNVGDSIPVRRVGSEDAEEGEELRSGRWSIENRIE